MATLHLFICVSVPDAAEGDEELWPELSMGRMTALCLSQAGDTFTFSLCLLSWEKGRGFSIG